MIRDLKLGMQRDLRIPSGIRITTNATDISNTSEIKIQEGSIPDKSWDGAYSKFIFIFPWKIKEYVGYFVFKNRLYVNIGNDIFDIECSKFRVFSFFMLPFFLFSVRTGRVNRWFLVVDNGEELTTLNVIRHFDNDHDVKEIIQSFPKT